jgi:hypothetical protein
MAKIILTNGVINVEESYEVVLKAILYSKRKWIELIEMDKAIRHFDDAIGIKGDYRIIVNTDLIQCVKP